MYIESNLLREIFTTYDDKETYYSYQKIAKDYKKAYETIKNSKRTTNNTNNSSSSSSSPSLAYLINNPSKENKERLREQIKTWFFSLPLESRLKIATVENEWICEIIYQMHLFITNSKDNYVYVFKQRETPSPSDSTDITEDGIIYPPNRPGVNYISVSREKKNHTTETQTISFSQDETNNNYTTTSEYNNNSTYTFKNYFCCRSSRDNNSISPLLGNIVFYSVHKKHYYDCFTFHPLFLLKRDHFDNCFQMCSSEHMTTLIEPIVNGNKAVSYAPPNWIRNNSFYSLIHFVFACVEQAIVVKFVLSNVNNMYGGNKRNKRVVHSIINENALDGVYVNRKNVIMFLNGNYNDTSRCVLLEKNINVKEAFDVVMKDEQKKKRIDRWNKLIPQYSYNEYKKYWKNKVDVVEKKEMIEKMFLMNDNVTLVDLLVFQNVFDIWKVESYVKEIIYEKLIQMNVEKTVLDLTNDEEVGSKKGKKKRKNNNNSGNSSNSKKVDEEYEMYKPYYMNRICLSDINVYDGNVNINNVKTTIVNESDGIKRWIKNDVVLNMLVENVICVTELKAPDHFVNFFGNDNESVNNVNSVVVNGYHNVGLHCSNANGNRDDCKNNDDLEMGINDINVSHNNNSNKSKTLVIKKKNNSSPVKDDNDNDNNNSLGSITITLSSPSSTIQNQQSTTVNNDYDNTNTNTNTPNITTTTNTTIINNTNNDNNNISSSSSSSKQKKKKKEQTFFLFDTVKKKKPKRNHQEPSPPTLPPPSTSTSSTSSSTSIPKYHPFTPKQPRTQLTFLEHLHNDILTYNKNISSILTECSPFKQHCLTYIKTHISTLIALNHPNSSFTIDIYGSFATNLMIEASDIDIKISLLTSSTDTASYPPSIDSLFNELVRTLTSLNTIETITPISTASVPVIKLTIDLAEFTKEEQHLHTSFLSFQQSQMFTQFKFNKTEITKTHIDITFHSVSSTTTTTTNSIDYANEKISTYPEVALILRVLKRLFYFKNMNSAFNGGLSSFNLFLIVLSYVQYRKLQLKLMCYSKQSTPISNLGALLMECLQFFACFDFRNFKIDVNSQYPYLPIAMNDVYKGKSLVIIDPLSGMNASKSAYQIDEIQRTFYEGMNYLKQMQELYVNSNNVNNYVYGMFT